MVKASDACAIITTTFYLPSLTYPLFHAQISHANHHNHSAMKKLLSFILCLLLTNHCYADNNLPSLFLFLGGDEASLYQNQLNHSCVLGAQIIYSWKQLEPKKGIYNFSKIENDLRYLNKFHKKLFIQLQDRSFEPTVFNVPDYIREDPIYHGGVAMQYDFPGEGIPISAGWVARTWDPAVRERFHLLIEKLAAQFDGRIAGINLPETAIDLDPNQLPTDYSNDSYYHSVIINLAKLKHSFQQSIVMQYVNFFPGESNNNHPYMTKLFSFAIKNQIALGGPDVIPFRDSQMKNSYPFFHNSRGKLLIGMAIQEPDYTYRNPTTGDYFKFLDFYHFSTKYLGTSLLFWNIQEPFFSKQLQPKMNPDHFQCLSKKLSQ